MNFRDDGERVYVLWDKYARGRDVEGLLSLYAEDAVLETPLIPAVLDVDVGVLKGHAELRHFFEEAGRRRPNDLVRWYREQDKYFYDGSRLIWEYPRAAPDGDQVELVEMMDLSRGMIRYHRIYWGWFGVGQLVGNALSRQAHDHARQSPPIVRRAADTTLSAGAAQT
ncbi:MAG: nuclear transport factor 2 family protein [Rhodanobacteraceae bacterium]